MSAVHHHAKNLPVTANGTGTPQAIPSVTHEILGLVLNVSAVSGTSPSLTVTVQWSADGTNFFAASPADSFAAITAVGGVAQAFTIKAPWYRLAWTATGTSPNFTLTADANFA